MDPVSEAVGAALAAISGLLGWLGGRRALRAAASRRSPRCPCGHVLPMHEDNGGPCREEVLRKRYHKDGGGFVGHEWVPCGCRRYLGPELLRDIWTPDPGRS